MPVAQKYESLESNERENPLQEALHAGTGVAGVRNKIMALTDEFEAKKWFTRENIQANRQYLSEDNEYNTEENLQAFYQWMQEQGREAENWMRDFEAQIAEGERQGYVSKSDKEHLYALLMDYSEKKDFVYNLDFLKEESDKKLEHLQKARKRYDILSNHKLIENTGFLKTDENTRIEFPDEKTFMKLTVKERDEMLDKIETALPKAEKYAEETGKVESLKQYQDYKELLDKAKNEDKIIGKKTYEKFWKGFKVCDSKEKDRWIKEFDSQMKRYDDLWTDIRSQTKGEELSRLESLRHQKGYSELLHEFKETEGKLDKKYEEKLLRYYQEGVIGIKTFDSYVSWIKKQPIPKKYEALEKLDSRQMKPWRELWQKIDDDKALNKEARQYLHNMKDKWGLSKTTEEYNRLRNGGKVPQGYKFQLNSKDPLAAITNPTVRQAIIDTTENLKKQGGSVFRRFTHRVTRLFSRVSRDRFDSVGFASGLQKSRQKMQEKAIKEKLSEEKGDNVYDLSAEFQRKRARQETTHETRQSETADEGGIEKEIKKAEATGKVKVVKERGFRQVETEEGRRVTFRMNEERERDRFMVEDSKNEYQTEKGDQVAMAIRGEGGQTIELDYKKMKATEKYLKTAGRRTAR